MTTMPTRARLTTIILTKNEEQHLDRALRSITDISDEIFVIDSGSTDRTVMIAEEAGAKVLSNPWINHATQFNWALDHLPPDTEWVLRLDADETVSESLAAEIKTLLSNLPRSIVGVYIPRRITFLGRPILWGGLFPVCILRMFRFGRGRCEIRWMDEHIIVEGDTLTLRNEIIDDNRNSLSWWTQKHNLYSTNEVIDLLNLEYRFMPYETVANLRSGQQTAAKRWLKEHAYARLPGGLRAFAYFFYRFVIRLGFLDGREGTAFHILQGFWYRYLVDAKLLEVRLYMRRTGADVVSAIREVLGTDPLR